MNFCSACGQALVRRVPPGEDRLRDTCSACGLVHYQNPRVVVGSVATWEERVLLCRRAIEPRLGLWTLPAGYLELGESTEEGARREAWEEALARIEVTDLLALYDLRHIDQVQVFFRARLLDPQVAAGPESLEVGLFAWEGLPWDELAFPTVARALRFHRQVRGSAPFAPDRGLPGAGLPALELGLPEGPACGGAGG